MWLFWTHCVGVAGIQHIVCKICSLHFPFLPFFILFILNLSLLLSAQFLGQWVTRGDSLSFVPHLNVYWFMKLPVYLFNIIYI